MRSGFDCVRSWTGSDELALAPMTDALSGASGALVTNEISPWLCGLVYALSPS